MAPLRSSRPMVLIDDIATDAQIRSAVEKFDIAREDNRNLNQMGDAIYELLAIAAPYVCIRANFLDSEQQEFMDWALSCNELTQQDVSERNYHGGLSPRELGRSFVRPLLLFLGLFAELRGDADLNARLVMMRTVMVVQAAHHLAADWDLAPEILLPEFEDLTAALESYDLGAMSSAVMDFRDAILAPYNDAEFDLSTSEADPLKRYTEEEMAEFRASSIIGYGRPSVPRFADGPRLERLQRRIAAIVAGQSVEPYRLTELQEVVRDIELHRKHLAYLDDQARKGLVGFTPSDSATV